MKRSLLLLALLAGTAHAQSVALHVSSGILLLADGGRRVVEVHDPTDLRLLWSAEGPAEPSSIVLSQDRRHAAVLDNVNSIVQLIDLEGRSSARVAMAAPPSQACFAGDQLLVLSRDGARLTNSPGSAGQRQVPLRRDSTSVRTWRGTVLVYSRGEGVVDAYDPRTLRHLRSAVVAPFASDLQVSGANAYLLFPREARIIAFDLEKFTEIERISVGAVPVDLAPMGERLAVADPGSKRVWFIEKTQSAGQAFARGFLRGLIGIGVTPVAQPGFESGVDRIWTDGNRGAALDTARGTLYSLGSPPVLIARGIRDQAIGVSGGHVFFWDPGTRRIRKVALRR